MQTTGLSLASPTLAGSLRHYSGLIHLFNIFINPAYNRYTVTFLDFRPVR